MERRNLALEKKQATPQLFNLITLIGSLTTYLSQTRFVIAITQLYSLLLGKKFTPRQAVYILYAQTCLILALLPFSINLGWRLLFFVWFYQAVNRSGLISLFRQEQ